MSRKNLIAALFFPSLIALAISWIQHDRFVDDMPLDPAIDEPPRQHSIDREPFTVSANEVDYAVQPLYNYELTGLVVSFKRFSPGIGLHERWNDYINIADVCVVWGINAREVDLNQFSFWNGEFTCNFKTGDRQAWQTFEPAALSNNHIVTDNERLREEIDDLQVGDQVYLRGWLAEYGQPDGPVRGTSTTRTDTGNGACETVYLNDFRIIESMESDWRRLFWLAIIGLVASLVLWVFTPQHKLRKY